MSEMPLEANVVLTADNTQYDAAMRQSAMQTDAMGKSVDSLTAKLDRLAKSAGRKMMGIAAADVAGITAATVAYGAWEKQMTSLSAQAAVLNRNMDSQKRTFGEYAQSVNGLRKEFGTTTHEAAALVQTLSKLNDSTAPVNKLAQTFVRLGAATGESSVQLANSMLQLQKTMGTPQRETEKFANQLTVLQSRSNSTGTAILDFAQQIAPVGRMVGMTQTDIMGFSNAFIKAGQDGYQASTVFNRMLSDIAQASQSGSPELAKYANLVGMTVENFKNLGGTDQFLKIFDSINRAGPQAITTLNRMGLDGMRTVRTVTAMAQQSGGLRSEILAARSADPGALGRGSEAAFEGLFDQLKKLRSELALTGESLGKTFAPAAKGIVGTIETMASAVRGLMEGPFGKMVGIFAMAVAPIAAVGAAIFTASKALLAFSTANLLLRNSFTGGFREGRTPGAAGMVGAGLPVTALGPVGSDIARSGSWVQRGLYRAGALGGMMMGAPGPPGRISQALRIPETGFGSSNMFARTASAGVGWAGTGAGWLARNFIGGQYSAGSAYIPGIAGTGGMDDYTKRWRFFNAPTVGGSFGGVGNMLAAPFRGFAQGLGFTSSRFPGNVSPTPGVGNPQLHAAGMGAHVAAIQAANASRLAESTAALNRFQRTTMSASTGLAKFAHGMGNMTAMIASSGVGAARAGGRFGMQALGQLGITPMLAGLLGVGAAGWALNKARESRGASITDEGGFITPYLDKVGMAGIPTASRQRAPSSERLTLSQAKNVSRYDAELATRDGYKLSNKKLANLKPAEAVATLSTNWGYTQKNPAAVNEVVMDLVNVYGVSGAQSIVAQLDQSKDATDLSTFITSAKKPGMDKFSWLNQDLNPFDTSDVQSGKKSSKSLNKFYGALSDQYDYVFATKGEEAARKLYGEQLEKGVAQFGKGSSGALDQAFQEEFLVNVLKLDKKDIDFKDKGFENFSGETDPNLPGNFDLKTVLKSMTSGGGFLGDHKEQLEKALSFYGLDTGLRGEKAAAELYKMITNPPTPKGEGPSNRDLLKQTSARQGVTSPRELSSVQAALDTEGDINKQYTAINEIISSVQSIGPAAKQLKFLAEAMNQVGGDEGEGAGLFGAARQQIMRRVGFQMPYMNRTQQFSTQTDVFRQAMATPVGHGFTMADRDAQIEQYHQQTLAQADYFKSMLLQQREFNVMRSRAEEDYNLQRQYQSEDYYQGIARAQEDFNIQRNRSEADFERNRRRQRDDFNRSRRRQEQDHLHQVELMTKQAAMSMYNIYERIGTQRTSGADYMLFNAEEQLKQMQGQAEGLDKLRGLGLSDDAIQQLGLNDPKNAQQLQRMLSDLASNPELVKKFNDMVRDRLQAAGELVTDESSSEWEEFNRQYNLARERAQADFERSMKKARKDFRRNMGEMEEDFKRALERQASDYSKMMDRQATAYSTSMTRAAEDLERAATTIDGTFEEILTKATKKLSGHAAEQAKEVLAEFKNLKTVVGPEAISLMSALAEIFGVEYKAPKFDWSKPNTNQPVREADGGVLPGYSPGQDIHTFHSATAGSLMLSGGEAIMRPEWVRAVGGPGAVERMNRAAKYGGFADGGVIPQERIDAAKTFAKSQVGDPYTWGGVGPNGFDCSGFMSAITNVLMGRPAYSRVGGTGTFPWPGFFPGTGQFTIGSANPYPGSDVGHMAGTLDGINVESRGGIGVLVGPRARGYGDAGFNQVFHLGQAGKFGTGLSGDGGGVENLPKYKALIKDMYRGVEMAANMDSMRPLQMGHASQLINQFGRIKYKSLKNDSPATWNAMGGIFSGPQTIGIGEGGPEMVLPLDERGADFVSILMNKVMAGNEGKGLRTAGHEQPIMAHTVHSYQIDRSTTFTGDICVQANNPQELLQQLQAKQRTAALSNPGKR